MKEGYIAITSAIIISVLLMTISFTLSISTFFTRSNILDSTFKEISYALAEACVDTALLKLALNSSYSGNETITINSDPCTIKPVESGSGQKTVKTRADFRGAVTNLKVVVNSPNLSIVSWEEF